MAIRTPSAPAAEIAVGPQQWPLVRQEGADPSGNVSVPTDPLPDALFCQFFHINSSFAKMC